MYSSSAQIRKTLTPINKGKTPNQVLTIFYKSYIIQ